MKVKVDKDSCIGCGACAAICPEIFDLDDDGLSEVKTEEVKNNNIDDVKDAVDSCPTGAIKIEE